jgi:hypothetical protein
MAKLRGPAEFTIITPALTLTELKGLATTLVTTYQNTADFTVAACATTSGSATITTSTANGFQNVAVGMGVTGTGIPSGATVITKGSSTSLTISANATATGASVTLTFTPLNVIIKASDQLEAATLNIEEMYQENMTQSSMAPFNKTKVGMTSNAQISIADDRIDLMRVATNAAAYQGAGGLAGGLPELITMGDDSGLTTGSLELPYRTVVIRPYVGGQPATDPTLWYIFPYAGVEGKLNLSFSIQNQRAYNMTLTAYDPNETNYKVLRGSTALLP